MGNMALVAAASKRYASTNNFSESLNIDSKVLKAAWDTNLKVRPEKDWETLEGRAVIDND